MSREQVEEVASLMSLAMSALMRDHGIEEYVINTENYDAGNRSIGGSWNKTTGEYTVRSRKGDIDFSDLEGKEKILVKDGDVHTEITVTDGNMSKLSRSIVEKQLKITLLAINRLMDETNRINLLLSKEDWNKYNADISISMDPRDETVTIFKS